MTANNHITFSASDVARYYAVRAPQVQQRASKEWRGPCPLHDGDRDSFVIQSHTGMWFCHSACSQGGDIIAFEMRLNNSDFKTAKKDVFDLLGKTDEPLPKQQRPAKSKGRIVATYDYADENGNLLFQTVRMEPKDFRQRAPGPNGTWIWNLSEVRRVLFQLPQVIAAKTVFVLEGEKDALALQKLLPANVVATCNPMGAGKWQDSYSDTLKGKRVIIIPDRDAYDPSRKASQQFPGQRHAVAIAESLKGKAERVGFVHVPAPHKDFSDWLSAETVTFEMIAKIITATPPEIEVPGQETHEEEPPPSLVEMPRPTEKLYVNDLARLIMLKHRWICSNTGGLWKYNGRCWVTDTDHNIKAIALATDGDKWSDNKRRNEVTAFIRAATHNHNIQWRNLENYEVPTWNGIVDVRTRDIRPHRWEDMIEATAAVEYDPDADCPRWKQALQTYFGDDPHGRQKITALCQFFGYALMQHARYKKALVCFGDSNTGKSAVGEILTELVGRQNVCGIPVHHMGDPRHIAPIVGKSVNLITELSSHAVIEDGGFKQLVSTGDAIQVDPKFIPPFSYVPVAKHVILTNALPHVNDRSRGTFERLLIVRFNRVLQPHEQDPTIFDQLRAELPGILTWAIEGAASLYEAGGKFVKITDADATIRQWEQDSNPVNEFIAERCVVEEGAEIQMSEFRAKYLDWLPKGTRVSTRMIHSNVAAAGFERKRGDRGFVVPGLRWRD